MLELAEVLSEKIFNVVRFDHLSTRSGVRIDSAALRVESITSGQRHTIVHIQISGSPSSSLLVGWGTSRHGQLGPPSPLVPLSSKSNPLKPPPFTSLPQIIELDDDNVVSSALGIHHSLFLYTSGHISALGSNRKGQLQLSSSSSQSVQEIGCTWNGSYAVVKNNEEWRIHSSGSNSHGQLGLKTTTDIDIPGFGIVHFPEVFDCKSTCLEIACGSEHVLALSRRKTEDDLSVQQTLWGWGWNEHGNLGIGNTQDILVPVKIWSNSSPVVSGSYFEGGHEVIGIWAGAGTSWICCSHILP